MKRRWCLFCVMLSCLCCIGCGKEKQQEVLTICVESELENDAEDILNLWEALNDGAEGKLEVLPKDSDARNIKISNIRTELMSGKGPDLFLLSAQAGSDTEESPYLFPNPEKIMYTDTFLPLDSFLEQTEYAKPENWNQKILEAGRTEKGQLILPLTYRYQKYAFPKSALTNAEGIPSSWEELRTCEDAMIQNAMYLQAYNLYPLFGKIADYEEEKLTFSEEELQRWASEAAEYIIVNETNPMEHSAVTSGYDDAFYNSLIEAEEEIIVSGFPNINGGVRAEVVTYAAVNGSTTKKEEVYSFLDVLFSDEVLCGQGMEVKDKTMGTVFYLEANGNIIHNRYVERIYPELSEEKLAACRAADEYINEVCFYSNLEDDLQEMFRAYVPSYLHKEEAKLKELVSKTYDAMQMKVLE